MINPFFDTEKIERNIKRALKRIYEKLEDKRYSLGIEGGNNKVYLITNYHKFPEFDIIPHYPHKDEKNHKHKHEIIDDIRDNNYNFLNREMIDGSRLPELTINNERFSKSHIEEGLAYGSVALNFKMLRDYLKLGGIDLLSIYLPTKVKECAVKISGNDNEINISIFPGEEYRRERLKFKKKFFRKSRLQ